VVKIALGQYADTRFRCERDLETDLRCATYVVGSPGVGKSTLLANLAESFTGAGEGVLVVDIKGELAEDIAARTRYPERLIYVTPGETTFPSGTRYWTLNPLEVDRSQEHLAEIAVANLLSLFERMHLARMDVMVQVRQILQMSARLALLLPEPSFNDLSEVLHRQVLREQLLADPRTTRSVRRFWESFNALTPAKQQERINSTMPRLNEFLSAPVVDHLVGHPRSTIRLREWLDAGYLVVCNLGSKLALETSTLLGNFVVASLVNAAYARPTGHDQQTRVWRVSSSPS
jgi:DNA helicase HerA-like ATPase